MAHHLVVAAAGRGERFGAAKPKQYAELAGQPLIEHTLQNLQQLWPFASISLGLSAGDPGWTSQVSWRRVDGGASRAATVLAVLQSLQGLAEDEDWIWVQDAVRPFLTAEVVGRIQAGLAGDADALVVAMPAQDTLKRVNAELRVESTLDRAHIWCAQTPQICRYAKLLRAFEVAAAANLHVTDEAMAMEQAGYRVQLVLGSEDNIKITRPGDLRLAQCILQARHST